MLESAIESDTAQIQHTYRTTSVSGCMAEIDRYMIEPVEADMALLVRCKSFAKKLQQLVQPHKNVPIPHIRP
jgi:hypothetical protein